MNNEDFVIGMAFGGIAIVLMIVVTDIVVDGPPEIPSFTKMLDEWHDQKHRPAP